MKKYLNALCFVVCALLVLNGCAATANETAELSWNLADLGGGVEFHTLPQGLYLAGDYGDIFDYAKGTEEMSRPEPIRLSWTAEPQGKMSAVEEYEVEIQDLDGRYNSMTLTTAETNAEVYNLCINTTYIWRVTAKLEGGGNSVSPWMTFKTSDVAPRNLYVGGVTNVRDLGGWKTPSGEVRQGMIYRSGRFNESETDEINIEITEEGVAVMRNVLGIKSEIDLRMPDAHNTETGGITSSPLGDDVNYYNCPLEWSKGNYLTENVQSVKYFFTLAADENNYPIVFHCNIGTDRTGLFSFLINGLLGVSEEDLYRDYLFSNYGKINGSRSISGIQSSYLSTIKGYQGESLSEKIKNCLIELVGVSEAEIASIVRILSA